MVQTVPALYFTHCLTLIKKLPLIEMSVCFRNAAALLALAGPGRECHWDADYYAIGVGMQIISRFA